MAGVDGTKTSEMTQLTALASGDMLIVGNDISETDPGEGTKYITQSNLFGNTTEIPVNIKLKQTGASPTISLERVAGATAYILGGSSYGFTGTASTHNLRLAVDSAYKVEITTAGIVIAPSVYANDLNGGTIRTMVISDAGETGYDSSTERAKDVTGPLPYEKAKWILRIPVIEYSPKVNSAMSRVGYTAETVYDLSKGNGSDTVCFFETHEIGENGELIKIDMSKYENWIELRKAGELDNPKKVIGKKITKKDLANGNETEDVEIEIVKKVQGVNDTELIPYMMSIMQNQQAMIENLQVEIEGLKTIE